MSEFCCRLDQEFICGIVRNRSGISSGDLDICIRVQRTKKDLIGVIKEVEFLLNRLKEYSIPEPPSTAGQDIVESTDARTGDI